jgi:hypothetical protein
MPSELSNLADSRAVAPSRLSRWYWRVPLKLAIFGAVTLFVLFPYPRQFRRHLQHVMNMQAMVQPDAPELAAWDEDLRKLRERALAESPDPMLSAAVKKIPSYDVLRVQKAVERFVWDRVKYEWDWNVWGSADYMPTVGEMFAQARENGGQMLEDCDGRAVMAASILRRMGYDAQLVTDLSHVWVKTPEQELMGPGGKKAVVTTTKGTKVDVASMIADVPIALSYGVSVFPLWREMIIAAAAVLLLAWGRVSWRVCGCAAVLVFQGLLFMRLGDIAPKRAASVIAWPSWLGMGHILVGILILFVASMRGRQAENRAKIAAGQQPH